MIGSQQYQEALGRTVDGDMLLKSGLGREVAPLADKMDRKKLQQAISQAGAAGAIQAALGGAGLPPEMMNEALALAKFGEKNGEKFAKLVDPGFSYAKGGGGGGAKSGGGAASGMNPFAGLLGGGGGPSGGAGGMSFQGDRGPAEVVTDIFHTGTSQSIFQIVSDRVRRVEPRLR